MTNRLKAVILVLMGLVAGANADDGRTQNWMGTLDAGPVKLRLLFKITKSAEGKFSGHMISLDQNNAKVAVDSIEVKEGQLKMTLKKAFATYEGRVNKAGTEVKGKWKQGVNELDLTLRRVEKKEMDKLLESWAGKIDVKGTKLELIFNIVQSGKSTFATMDVPQQGAKGIRGTLARDKQSVTIKMPALQGGFNGKYNESKTELVGEWKQLGRSFPLTLKKTKKGERTSGWDKRPQKPRPPFPYTAEEVQFESDDGARLFGTLTIPKGNSANERFPAAILISGSGQQDRDETIFDHKPFLVIADHLSRHGIAVLRYDDRGAGKSKGEVVNATTKTFAEDAEAAFKLLQKHARINGDKIGFVGHSEGGLIAPLIAARNSDVAFVVMLAGPGVNGERILKAQTRLILEAGNADQSALDQNDLMLNKLMPLLKSDVDTGTLRKQVDQMVELELKDADEDARRTAKLQMQRMTAKWFRFFVVHEPAPVLAKVKCPILALNGEKDLQVPAKENLAAIRKVLEGAGHKRYKAKELKGLNHLFQTCRTGSPNEYLGIPETFSPQALKEIEGWINGL